MRLLVECTTEYQDAFLHDFCLFACERLEISDYPSLTFVEHTGGASFGSYQPSEEAIIIATEGRHTSDILRTLGHELVHHKQLSEGENLKTLEELEYEANAVAGMLMRDYNKLHPEMFELSAAVEPSPDTLGDSQGAVFPDPTRPSGPIEMAEATIKETDSDALTMLKLGNQALRAFPSSPRQREIQKQIGALRRKMKREGTPEYHTTLNEDGIVNASGSGALAEEKAGHVGTCVNSFDRGTGECTVPHLPYRDSSHFATGAENSHKVSKEHFLKHVSVPKHLEPLVHKKSTEFLHDREHGVHMMHDQHKDVHHFFTEEMGVGGGAAAGIGIGPDGEPGVSPRKKSPVMGPMRARKTFKQLKEEVRCTSKPYLQESVKNPRFKELYKGHGIYHHGKFGYGDESRTPNNTIHSIHQYRQHIEDHITKQQEARPSHEKHWDKVSQHERDYWRHQAYHNDASASELAYAHHQSLKH